MNAVARICLTAIVTCILAADATAQGRTAPILNRQDFAEILGGLPDLEQSRREVAETLFTTFEADFAQAASDYMIRWNAAWQRLAQAGGDWGRLDEFGIAESEDAWVIERRRLEAALIDNLLTLLDGEGWDAAEEQIRAAARRKMLDHVRQYRVIRYGVDLSDLMKQFTEDEGSGRAALDAYQYALEEALRTFEAEHLPGYRAWLRALARAGGNRTSEGVQDALSEWMTYIDEIERVNREAIDRFASSLDDDQAARFLRGVHELLFPAVFVQSPVEYLSVRFEEFEGLAPQTRDEIEQIVEAHASVADGIRHRLIAAIERWETSAARRRRMERERQGEDPRQIQLEHPAIPLWIDHNNAVENAMRQIASHFAQEELVQLPTDIRLLLRVFNAP